VYFLSIKVELLDDLKGVVSGKDAQMLYDEGYGIFDNGRLKLEPLEIAYLLFKGRVKTLSEGVEVKLEEYFSKLHSQDRDFWVKFTVYHDLKSRGRVVKPGFTSNSLLIYPSKNTNEPADKIVYIVEESKMMSLEELLEWLQIASRTDKEPIIAIVDRHGDVTYYSMGRFTPFKIGGVSNGKI